MGVINVSLKIDLLKRNLISCVLWGARASYCYCYRVISFKKCTEPLIHRNPLEGESRRISTFEENFFPLPLLILVSCFTHPGDPSQLFLSQKPSLTRQVHSPLIPQFPSLLC